LVPAVRAAPSALSHARRGLGSKIEGRTLDTPFISDTIPLAEGRLGTIEELFKSPGESVEELEVIAVVETDKVSLDIKATQAGVIRDVLVSVGDEVNETQPIYTLAE
jgi:biotin carboxyl carrier protein